MELQGMRIGLMQGLLAGKVLIGGQEGKSCPSFP